MNANTPQTPAVNTPSAPVSADPALMPGYNGHDTLSQTEASTVAGWIKDLRREN